MNESFASRLVLGWVAVYTYGLPTELRSARADEIACDLWSQHEEAVSTGRPDRALAIEILARLVLGMAADLAWRRERGRPADRSVERSTTVSSRFIGMLAIVGGLAFAIGVADGAVTARAYPDVTYWHLPGFAVIEIFGVVGLLALSLSLGWLGLIIVSRLESAVGLVAIFGAPAGPAGLAGAYSAVVLLPMSSAVVVLYLARIRAVHWPLALIHVASAPGLVLGIAGASKRGFTDIVAALILVYSVSWIAIGLELLLRGLPQARPVAPTPS
jgi:hypothetical protein